MSHLLLQSGSQEVTFFCNRTTLVHFFSNSPSYFILVASSKLDGMLTSSRKAAAVLGAFMTPRYAIMALCLPLGQYRCLAAGVQACLTALPPGGRSRWHS